MADTGKISDGYHTFDELYAHRTRLFIALCAALDSGYGIWRSQCHSDGSVFPGWFIMGIGDAPGQQVTYHLDLAYWDSTAFAETLARAPAWDGHTADDVLVRLQRIATQESN